MKKVIVANREGETFSIIPHNDGKFWVRFFKNKYTDIEYVPKEQVQFVEWEMKEVWWNYVVENKKTWVNGFTLQRLWKVRSWVLNDPDIMFDLLYRHNGEKESPEDMKIKEPVSYNHCIGNFVCNIRYRMREVGILKPEQ